MKTLNISLLILTLLLSDSGAQEDPGLEAPPADTASSSSALAPPEAEAPTPLPAPAPAPVIEEPELPSADVPTSETNSDGQEAETAVEPAVADSSPAPAKPERRFWECQLPGGSFSIGIHDIVSVSQHQYIIEGDAEYYETTVSTRSTIVARFYHRQGLPGNAQLSLESPLVTGKRALDRAQELIDTGRYVQRITAPDHGLPVKRARDIAVAPTVEFRLTTRADVAALYQSAHTAWKKGEDGLFQLATMD